jgi:hypothetical protein
MSRESCLAFHCVWTLLATLPLDVVAAGNEVFVDRFDRQNAEWKIAHAGGDAPGIVRKAGSERPGLHFVTQGLATASAPWDIGAEPFEFSFEIQFDYGSKRPWRWPGIMIGLASAAPEDMDEEDVTIFAGAIAQGVITGVRTGPFFDGHEVRPGVWRWTGRNASPRYALNMGGAGGHDYSVQWPSKRVDGLKLRFEIARTADDAVSLTVYHPHSNGRPWWTGQWPLPEELQEIPLSHLIVKTVVGPEVTGDPDKRIREIDEYRGRVFGIQGRKANGPQWPRIERLEAKPGPLADGSTLTLFGKGFAAGTTVEINGQRVQDAIFVSEQQLDITLAHLQPGQFNTLAVVHPSGLAADYPAGIPAGRFVARIEPREALPEGGDMVTLAGGGFDESTAVTIGGVEAAVVRRQGPSRLQVRVPASTQVGPAKVEVTGSGGEVFGGEPNFGYAPHPYVWFDEAGLARLREKFNSPAMANYRRLIIQYANRPEEEIGKIGQPNHSAILHAYLWAYLLTGEAEYKTRLMTSLDELLVGSDRFPSGVFGHPGQLRQQVKFDEFWCHNAEAVATIYDTLFAELAPRRRTQLLVYLDRAQAYYIDRVKRRDWWYWNNPSNTVAVGNGCGGIVAIALRHCTPSSAEAVDLGVDAIMERYRGIAEDGGCVEGNLYWDYGFTYQLMFGVALENATGDDRGLLSQPRYEKTPDFVKTQLGGAGRMLVFNDTQPWLTGVGVSALFGGRLDDDLLRWFADETVAAAANQTTRVFTRPQFYSLAFRVRDAKPAPAQFPGVPTVAYLPTLNWGVLRSDEQAWKQGLVVGVKGRDGATTHHAQEDLSGFTLDARGEALLIDPGYYQGNADKHSLPLIDGAGPNRRGRALIEDATACQDWRTMTVDASDAYKDKAERMRRVLVMHKDEAVIVLDDIVPKAGGRITHHLQCGTPANIDQGDASAAVVQGNQTWLTVRLFGPSVSLSCDGPLDFDRSWVYAEEETTWYRLSGEYTAEQGKPLVTVLLPHNKDTAAPEVTCEYKSKEIRVKLPGGETVVFAETATGWKSAAPNEQER